MQNQSSEIKFQLSVFDRLLRDQGFAQSMAAHLHSSYHTSLKETVPQFLTPADDTATIRVSKKEEKIAIKLAGFYALECGVGFLSERSCEPPFTWIERIAAGKADSNASL